ncbi:MAG: hypothetical protein KC609_01170, partial [Myxococcales bacterium]|nr:hypothetical protein [Myxococcales bacterium]
MPAQLPNLNKPGSGVPDLGFEKEPERTLVMSAPPDFDSLLQQVEQSKKSTMTAPTEENAEATVAMPAITDEMLNAAPPAPRPPVAQAPMPPSPRPQATPTPTPTPVVSSTPQPAIASAPTPSPSPGPAFRPDINSQATIPPHANLSAPPLVRGPQPGGPGPQFNPGAPQGPSGPTSLGGGLNQAGSASPVFQQRQSPPRPQPTPSQMPAPQSMAPNQRAGHA